MRDLLLWGATGQAKVIAEFAAACDFRVVALVDNDSSVVPPLAGVPLLYGLAGLDAFLAEWPGEGYCGVAAIGGLRGRDRLDIQELLQARGIYIPVLVHPKAYVAADATIGAGSQILVRATVCASTRIGKASIVNTASSVDHDCDIGDGVHIAPGATVAGGVTVGPRSFVGPGAVVGRCVRIGADVIIGAGAVVLDDLPDGTRAYGVPARSFPATRNRLRSKG